MRRLSCCIPFCRATRGNRKNDPLRPGFEWICSRHWRDVPAALKAEKRYWQRLSRRAKAKGLETPRIHARAFAAWEACKARAIETAMGL